MSKILSGLSSPTLAGVVKEKTKAAAIAEIKNCMYDGAPEQLDLRTVRTIIDNMKKLCEV